MCSYDPGTMNWANSYIFSNSPAFLEQLGHDTQELGIKPECEIFDGGMMGNVDYYVKKGVLKGPIHYQFVLGVAGGMRGNADSLAFLLPKMHRIELFQSFLNLSRGQISLRTYQFFQPCLDFLKLFAYLL